MTKKESLWDYGRHVPERWVQPVCLTACCSFCPGAWWMEVFSSLTRLPSAEQVRFAPCETNTSKIQHDKFQQKRVCFAERLVPVRILFLPCFLVHGFMHDEAPVDVQDSLAHVYMLLQKGLDVIGWFQEENVGGVGDEYLMRRQHNLICNMFTMVAQVKIKAFWFFFCDFVYLQCSLYSSMNTVLQQFTVYSLVHSLIGIKYTETYWN